MVVIIATASRPIPTSSQDGNENLQYADTLLRGCFFCVNTLHFISIFCKFYPSIQLTFFPYIDSKKVCTLIKYSCHKVSVISSVQYTLSFITSFCEEMFSQSRNFYENNMILWHSQIGPKVVWKVHGAWIVGYDSQNKYKNITITKNKSLLFFLCSVSYQKPCDSPPFYCCHLGRHLKYFTTLKNSNNMLVKFSSYN